MHDTFRSAIVEAGIHVERLDYYMEYLSTKLASRDFARAKQLLHAAISEDEARRQVEAGTAIFTPPDAA